MNSILKRLEEQKAAIVDRWGEQALEVYHPDTRRFYAKKGNSFSNPVGDKLRDGLSCLLDALIAGKDVLALGKCLEEIIQVRSVQEIKPSKAISFLFILKNVIQEALKDDLEEASLRSELRGLEEMIDKTALFAFDIFLKYRERVFDIRVNEVKRQVATLMRRSSFFDRDNESDSNIVER